MFVAMLQQLCGQREPFHLQLGQLCFAEFLVSKMTVTLFGRSFVFRRVAGLFPANFFAVHTSQQLFGLDGVADFDERFLQGSFKRCRDKAANDRLQFAIAVHRVRNWNGHRNDGDQPQNQSRPRSRPTFRGGRLRTSGTGGSAGWRGFASC